jgi:hypothetical protein
VPSAPADDGPESGTVRLVQRYLAPDEHVDDDPLDATALRRATARPGTELARRIRFVAPEDGCLVLENLIVPAAD